MYPVAHIVAASGAAWGAERAVRRVCRRGRPDRETPAVGEGASFDYRLAALGSWLPDAIDKPQAWFFLSAVVEDDHLVGHTLLFAAALAIPGLLLAWQGQRHLISLASGVIMHRLCDPMWPEPEHVVWPLYGWTFEHSTTPYFPVYLILEVVAAAILIIVLRRIWARGRMWLLLGDGEI